MSMRGLRSSAFTGVRVPVAPRAVTARAVGFSHCLRVENKTLWSLQVDQAWCDLNKEKCDRLEPSLDLTEAISDKLKCLVGETKDCDFTVGCDKTGVQVKFESVGASNALDSPAELYMTDAGGETTIFVDDKQLKLNQKVRLYPGSTVQLGDFARFQVLRNVYAHA